MMMIFFVRIITPYEAQRRKIISKIEKISDSGFENFMLKVKVANVDAFQGGERECIILSFIRSNDRGDIGKLTSIISVM